MFSAGPISIQLKQPIGRRVRLWYATIKMVYWMAFFGCIGLGYERDQQIYVGLLAIVVGLTYIFVSRWSLKDSYSQLIQLSCWRKSRAIRIAVGVGLFVNFAAEQLYRTFVSPIIWTWAFSAGYQMLIVALAPMPGSPSESVYHLQPVKSRRWMFGILMILIGFFGRLGLCLPLLFMYPYVAHWLRVETAPEDGAALMDSYPNALFIEFIVLGLALIYSLRSP